MKLTLLLTAAAGALLGAGLEESCPTAVPLSPGPTLPLPSATGKQVLA